MAGSSADRAADLLPLKPAWFHILLALADCAQHGYGIRAHVEGESDGRIRLWPATLYGTIRTLTDRGLIEGLDTEVDPQGDARRRYYQLTAFGKAVLRAETDRLHALVQAARATNALG